MKFKHTHGSGRYDRSPASLKAAVDGYMAESALVTLTEVSKEAREQVLRDLATLRGWSVVTGDKGGMDDSGILWDNDVFTKIAAGTHILSGYTYDAKGGGVCYAAWAVLQHENQRLLVLVAHQASGVERGTGLNGAAQRVQKWRKDTRAMKVLWNDLARRHSATAIVATCDWNVNIKRFYFRALFKQKFPGMTLVPRKPWPARGTLGDRLIDFSLIRGRIKGTDVHVMPANPSSDHKPFSQVLTLL